MASTLAARVPRLRIPSFPPSSDFARRKSSATTDELGSAHVSVELDEEQKSVCIQSECTEVPWQDHYMIHCGIQANGKHLYTMLYDDVPVGPVLFRMSVGDKEHFESDFYEHGENQHPWVGRQTYANSKQ
jgi:hypothetical protein